MKERDLRNPMCIRLSEETVPSDPTPHYDKKKKDTYKGGVKAIEKDGTEREFNSLIEASDYYDLNGSGILRAMSLKRTFGGIAFRYPSFNDYKSDAQPPREDVESY
jgi:hypothetical protein